jgi:hypothetical protein
MSQKDFNKDIDDYINRQRSSEDTVKDVERIKKQANAHSVEETHPGLSNKEVHVIKRDDPWLKRIVNSVTKKEEAIRREEAELPEEPDKEFEEEEQKLEKELGTTYWQRFVNWLKGKEGAVDEFEGQMDELDEKEREIVRKEHELAHEETELAEERVSAVRGFLYRFRPRRQNEDLREQLYDVQEDMKSIAKITTTVMRQLPADKLHQYKRTGDFQDFKAILRKHNLIKDDSEQPQEDSAQQTL